MEVSESLHKRGEEKDVTFNGRGGKRKAKTKQEPQPLWQQGLIGGCSVTLSVTGLNFYQDCVYTDSLD